MDGRATWYERASQLFRLLSHRVRLRILDELRCTDAACVCHLQTIVGRAQPYVSQQLRLLREAGVVQSRRDGLFVYYRLVDPQVAQVLQAMLGGRRPRDGLPSCFCPDCSP